MSNKNNNININNTINTDSASDIEHGIPKPTAPKRTASNKLKNLDKKTYVFAGFMFWAIIIVAGGATAGTLLTQKKSSSPSETVVPSTIVPTETPSAAPTDVPSESPTNYPSQSPTRTPLSTLHYSTLEKLDEKFDGCFHTYPAAVYEPGLRKCLSKMDNLVSVEVDYEWKQGQYTFQEGVGFGIDSSESAPFINRPVSVTITAAADKIEGCLTTDCTFYAGVFVAASKIHAANVALNDIFPITHTIKIDWDCGIDCFKVSLDIYLKEVDGALKQAGDILKAVEPYI